MRKIDYILISVFVLLSALLLVKEVSKTPLPPLKKEIQKDLPASARHSLADRTSMEGKFTGSQFEKGLPPEFWPQDISRFSNLEKLEEDLHYRKLRMYQKFREEQEAFQRQKGQAFETDIDWMALKRTHATAEGEFHDKYESLVNEFKDSRQKFLREDNLR